jgi:hypothetical protein
MTRDSTAIRTAPESPAASDTKQQVLDRVLSQELFKPLKAILDNLRLNGVPVCDAVRAANSYPELLAALGYRMNITKQLHEQDCYTRLGPDGGIKAVLPYHDMTGYRTLVTLVNFDSTVTTTPDSATFFSALFLELKKQLKG